MSSGRRKLRPLAVTGKTSSILKTGPVLFDFHSETTRAPALENTWVLAKFMEFEYSVRLSTEAFAFVGCAAEVVLQTTTSDGDNR